LRIQILHIEDPKLQKDENYDINMFNNMIFRGKRICESLILAKIIIEKDQY